MNDENNELITCHKCGKEYEKHLIYYLEEDGELKPICVFCKQKV